MKQICIECERTASDQHLWCLESYCPIGQMPFVFDYGETVGDLKVIKPFAILQTSTIYVAEREGERVFLKVAHDTYQDRLKREVAFLEDLQKKPHPMIPKLLPAYRGSNSSYGKTTYDDRIKYYYVFEHSEGEPLRDYLLKNRLPWHQHAGWIAVSLAEAVGVMHQKHVLHLALNPESVLLRFDVNDVPRIQMLDLGAVCKPQDVGKSWHNEFVPDGYLAPELLGRSNQITYSTDVYGIGLILYEMLTGNPAFPYRLRPKNAVYQAITKGTSGAVNRKDLTTWPEITRETLNKNPEKRQQSVFALAQSLLKSLPPLPKEKPPGILGGRYPAWVFGGAAGVAAAIAAIIWIFVQ